MRESTVPLGGDTSTDTTLDMLKRVLAVAELVAKTVPPNTDSKPSVTEKSPTKTQK
ncbi:hypothetical protein QPK87_22760 [Kamptonema cortianum]|nr:hypothetical protein [Kamptonema cortianum]